MPIPIVTHPKPARRPATAPQAGVVLESFRNIARLNAMTRLNTKLMTNVLGVAGASFSFSKPLASFQARPKRMGEYQSPPMINADSAETRIAQRFRVSVVIGLLLYCLEGARIFGQSSGPDE